MSNERTPYLQELIRNSTEATLLLANILFDEESDPKNRFKNLRDSLQYLKNDEQLIITEKRIDDEFTEINIAFRSWREWLSH